MKDSQISQHPTEQDKGHPIRNLCIFIGIIFALAILAEIFNADILAPSVSFMVREWGYSPLVETLAGWILWATLPVMISILSYRLDMYKRLNRKMDQKERYFWWIAISLLSALLIIVLATTVPRLGGHSNSFNLSAETSRFVSSSYYVSGFIISMVWTLLGWTLLIGLDGWFHSSISEDKEWSMAWIFGMVPVLSLATVLIAALSGVSVYLSVLGVPLVYLVSRTGYLFTRKRRTLKQVK